jgi:hypothetical protein
MTLAPSTDYKIAERRLLDAVNHVFNDYRDRIEAQHAQISRTLHVDMGKPVPEGRLRFVDEGVEFVVRYPVDIHRATEIDDCITRELLKTINEEPQLQIVSGTPKIRTA